MEGEGARKRSIIAVVSQGKQVRYHHHSWMNQERGRREKKKNSTIRVNQIVSPRQDIHRHVEVYIARMDVASMATTDIIHPTATKEREIKGPSVSQPHSYLPLRTSKQLNSSHRTFPSHPIPSLPFPSAEAPVSPRLISGR